MGTLISVKIHKEVNSMDVIALILTIIGCANWGLVGLLKFDLVAWLFGSGSLLSSIIYTVIALAGIWCITFFFCRSRLTFGDNE